MIKKFYYFVQAIIIYFLYFIGYLIGIKLSRKMFSYLFMQFGPMFKSNKVISNNLSKFSRNISNDEKKIIVKEMWKNYGMTFIEYIFLSRIKKDNSKIKVIGKEKLLNIIKKNKKVIFISGHFANFELMSMKIVESNIKLATIYRPLNNFFLNPFMEFLRRKYVCENQIKKGRNGVRDAINYLRNDFSIALMIDQRVTEGERINFFGHPALTTTLPAQLALKFNIPIVPVFIERKGDAYFEIEFLDEIEINNSLQKSKITEKLNNVLEKMILKNSNQWIWTHNRWK